MGTSTSAPGASNGRTLWSRRASTPMTTPHPIINGATVNDQATAISADIAKGHSEEPRRYRSAAKSTAHEAKTSKAYGLMCVAYWTSIKLVARNIAQNRDADFDSPHHRASNATTAIDTSDATKDGSCAHHVDGPVSPIHQRSLRTNPGAVPTIFHATCRGTRLVSATQASSRYKAP